MYMTFALVFMSHKFLGSHRYQFPDLLSTLDRMQLWCLAAHSQDDLRIGFRVRSEKRSVLKKAL